MGLVSGAVIRTLSEENMKAVIDAQSRGDSLAGRDDYSAVARALDRAGMVNAFLTTGVQKMGGRGDPDTTGQYGSATSEADLQRSTMPDSLLRPYQLLGFGQGTRAGTDVLMIVLYSRNVGDARENADLVKHRIAEGTSLGGRRWSEGFTGVETRVNGHVTEITLTGPWVPSFNSFWISDDPLLLSK